jgi:hypothetical protein
LLTYEQKEKEKIVDHHHPMCDVCM